MIHPTSDVQTRNIGHGTDIWQFCVILSGAKIGCECNINAHVFIEEDVVIGDRVTVKSGVQLWNGLRVGNDVFIGPNVTFTNDIRPRSKKYQEVVKITTILNNSSIGANATILPGVTIGMYSMVGAGAVVTKSIPDRALFVGFPARFVSWINEDGSKMISSGRNWIDKDGAIWKVIDGKLQPYE